MAVGDWVLFRIDENKRRTLVRCVPNNDFVWNEYVPQPHQPHQNQCIQGALRALFPSLSLESSPASQHTESNSLRKCINIYCQRRQARTHTWLCGSVCVRARITYFILLLLLFCLYIVYLNVQKLYLFVIRYSTIWERMSTLYRSCIHELS